MDRKELISALHGHPLTARVDDAHLPAIAAAGEVESYGRGETIVQEGSLGDAIFLVLHGSTGVFRGGAGGRRLAELQAGDFFGEMCLVEPARRCASVVALEPTLVFRLPNQAVHRLAEQDARSVNALLAAVVRTLSERLRRMNETLAEVGQLSDWLKGSLV
jgi:CRP-like cAMP-binding protein